MSISLVAVAVLTNLEEASDVSSLVAAVFGVFGVMAVWAWRRNPRRRSTTGQVAEAAQVLARLVGQQWQSEALLRQLFDPAPLPVRWTDCSRPNVSDHRQLIGAPVTCRADATQELVSAFRSLPRRRLVVLGDAGSGKTTLAVLLTLALLRDREANDPVPVLLSFAAFDAARDGVHAWLRQRIAADYPALADTEAFGPTAIEDLLVEGRVLPVLDGLDELPEQSHTAVLTTLNDTLDPHTPLVLTCRTTEYTNVVSHAGVLAGAAVIEPAPVHPDDALALLRLATPPGPRQESWDALGAHVARSPQASAARALANPLMVSLARAVYADAPGDPAELADTRRFPTAADIEYHLLDNLVPTLYTRAHRQNPSLHSWNAHRAHRYLTYLAQGLHGQDTHDLAWWRLYRWVPAVTHTCLRALIWGMIAFAVSVPLLLVHLSREHGVHEVVRDLAVIPVPLLFSLGPWLTASFCAHVAGAWTTARSWGALHPLAVVLSAGICGGLAGSLVRFSLESWEFRGASTSTPAVMRILSLACWFGLPLLMVLLSVGPPTPPRMPSQGTFTMRNWPRRLLRALVTMVLAVAFSGATLHLSGAIENHNVVPEQSVWRIAWAYGVGFGVVIGAAQAALQWTRSTASANEFITPSSSVRTDRFVSLLSGLVGAAVIAASLEALDAFEAVSGLAEEAREDLSLAEVAGDIADGMLGGLGGIGLSLAWGAHAWPHYMITRSWQAARGHLPWRLQAFLADAHKLGILRQVGPVYQFRHARLLNHLAAGSPRLPGPRASSPQSDSSHR
ncbi:NACHT domain-containing protein [Streptomyces sp. NPDC056948]|uniref:NACHT domain-containing protein n=1 Tax=Streptomyces sp. NPDC056948 TaxID=3345975 RepID=UPI003641F84A